MDLTETELDEPMPADVLAAKPGQVVVTRDTINRHQHIVWRDQEVIGVVFDETEAKLNRGPFAIWSNRIPGPTQFFDTLDTAVDAITEANMPTGPGRRTEPGNRADKLNFRILPARRRSLVLASAATLYDGTRTIACCFKEALQADRTEHLPPLPDESEFEMCIGINGGEIHTATTVGETVHPLCRTMAQDSRGTCYRITTARDLTCKTCIGYREYRKIRRAAA